VRHDYDRPQRTRPADHTAAVGQHLTNDRLRKVINRLLREFKGPLTTSKYAKIAGCSPDTALRDIRELIDFNVLLQNPGKGRSTSYRLREPDELR
jgi:Fic family protein